MSDIGVLVLGAGQEVGRSCVVLRVDSTYIMMDCGMHVGYRDARRFPDFKLLCFEGRLTEMISAVVITHFHLDHCAALPYLTEVCGYHGPVYATHPTRAIMPIMLQDYHKVMTERHVGHEWYTLEDVKNCMRNVIGVDLNAATEVAPGVAITALYAGHVLGAAQFVINIHGHTILYTGDYNTSADTHLGAAQITRLRPDLLITESTYSTTLRDSKKSRERDFTSEVVRTVLDGGKVLIPVMAVGRAQELLILVEDTWRRHGLLGKFPLYFAGAMGGRANQLYRAHVNWASQQLKRGSARHAAFAFEHIQPWDPALMNSPGPVVLFASPGMLNGGTSLEVFKAWAPDPRNLVVMPGYQVAGTVGGKLMSGKASEIQIGTATVQVQCKIRVLAFSAHSDAAGILQLVAACSPRAVMLVHGDKVGQAFMASRITRLLEVPCFYPPSGGDWTIVNTSPPPLPITTNLSAALRTATAICYPQPSTTTSTPATTGNNSRAVVSTADRLRLAGQQWPAVCGLELPGPMNAVCVSGVLVGFERDGQAEDLELMQGEDQIVCALGELKAARFTMHLASS